MKTKQRAKLLNKITKNAFSLALTDEEQRILDSASAQDLQEAYAFADRISAQNIKELIEEEDAKLASLLAETE